MSNYILASNGELYHYGVKGMKWGQRKKQIRQDEIETGSALKKKYKLFEAQDKAELAYQKYGMTDRVQKLSDHADSIESKVYSELKTEMKKKYGKDYDRYKRGESVANTLLVGGVLTGAVGGTVLAGVALGKLATETVKLGTKMVGRIIVKANNK